MELEDIKKLRPEERIKRLKELEEKRKQEIETAEELIRSSEQELRVEEELRDIPIPQVKAVDIEQLFGAEEKQIFRAKRLVPEETPDIVPTGEEKAEEESLEETLTKEAPTSAAQAGPVYGLSSEQVGENLGDLYNVTQEKVFEEMTEMRNRAAGGTWNEEDDDRLQYRMNQMEKAAQSQQYAGQEAQQRFGQTMETLDQIKMYKRKTGV